jgi:hypothetical protein
MLRLWLARFLFTQLVEVPIYSYALRGQPLVAFGASALTHPFVFFVFPRLWPDGRWAMIALAEAFAVIVEALYLRRFGLRRALLWSLLSNGASFTLTPLSHRAFGWP